MADKADESPVDEVVEIEVTEQPEVELDRATDVEGDLIDNPAIEEVEEEDGQTEQPAADEGTDEPAESGDKADEAAPTGEAETIDAPAAEADETGVYEQRTATDPGDFQPKSDYSFEVTTTDGKTLKITSQAEADALAERLDENPELLSVSQYTKFNRGVVRMDTGLERERVEYETQKEQFETQQRQEQIRNDQLVQWNNEINYLQAKGALPEIDAAKNADWLANQTDPAVKARMEIFEWMDKENQSRRAAGITEVTSAVDAYSMMKAEQAQSVANDERTREADTRRAKGSMIGGSAPYEPDNTPKNSIVGPGGSLSDLIMEAQNNL